jgi:hypothetical protein
MHIIHINACPARLCVHPASEGRHMHARANTEATACAEGLMRIIGTPDSETRDMKPYKIALAAVLSQAAVMQLQLPYTGRRFVEIMRGIAAQGKPVLWCDVARMMTFEIATRSVLGDAITAAQMEALFPLYSTMASGALTLVRLPSCSQSPFTQPASVHAAAASCRRAAYRHGICHTAAADRAQCQWRPQASSSA